MFIKYYVIYVKMNPDDDVTARFLCIVEKKEVAQDFCNKHAGCYYVEEVAGG